MRRFWDEAAERDAFFYVDDRLRYGDPDLEAFWAEGPKVVARVLDIVGARIEPGDTVVEIGCGVGRLTRALAASAERVVALDISERMIELARRHNAHLDGVEWIVGDGESLAPVADASADACFSHVVFQHVPDPRITLGYVREMGRVLRPGGWSAFQVSNDPSIHRPRRRTLRDRVAVLAGRAPKGQDRPEWLGSSVDLADLRATAHDAGMLVERVTGEGTQFCFVLLRRQG
jgi:SAM-dependent methyltransferase